MLETTAPSGARNSALVEDLTVFRHLQQYLTDSCSPLKTYWSDEAGYWGLPEPGGELDMDQVEIATEAAWERAVAVIDSGGHRIETRPGHFELLEDFFEAADLETYRAVLARIAQLEVLLEESGNEGCVELGLELDENTAIRAQKVANGLGVDVQQLANFAVAWYLQDLPHLSKVSRWHNAPSKMRRNYPLKMVSKCEVLEPLDAQAGQGGSDA